MPSRRTVLRGLAAVGLAAALPACAPPYRDLRLTLATGAKGGNYFTLGTALARAWQTELAAITDVLTTGGSLANLTLLASGGADAVISQVDTAVDQWRRSPDGPRSPRALTRIYDDVVHVVVPSASPVTSLAGLRGIRVSVGASDSGVLAIARRLLRAAGIDPATGIRPVNLGITGSVAALEAGTIDAFFWSGGLPTPAVDDLAARMPIRLLDLTADDLKAIRQAYPVYTPGTVPAGSYGITEPINTLLVRNFLLVGAGMPDDLAQALIRGLFQQQPQLAQAIPLALTIDLRAAIGTQPVPLHPGALRFFREEKLLGS
jgi:TRAP transporter TAXI family solute receptor